MRTIINTSDDGEIIKDQEVSNGKMEPPTENSA